MRYVSGTKLDERVIRCDLDPGYREGRQYGRGKSGGQVRDEYRQEYDAGRGGWGHNRLREEEERQRIEAEQARREKREELYQEQDLGMGGGGGGLVPAGAEHMYEETEADARGHTGQQAPSSTRNAGTGTAKKRDRSYDDDDDEQLYGQKEKVSNMPHRLMSAKGLNLQILIRTQDSERTMMKSCSDAGSSEMDHYSVCLPWPSISNGALSRASAIMMASSVRTVRDP